MTKYTLLSLEMASKDNPHKWEDLLIPFKGTNPPFCARTPCE